MSAGQGRGGAGDLERRARDEFEASVRQLDAGTCDRLAEARRAALAAATRGGRQAKHHRHWPGRGWSMAAMAASFALVALLLVPQWRAADDAAGAGPRLPGAIVQQDAVGLLEASDEELQIVAAREELEFYAWVDLAGRG